MQDGAYAAEIRQREEVLRRKRRLARPYHRRRRMRLPWPSACSALIVACVIIAVIAGGSTDTGRRPRPAAQRGAIALGPGRRRRAEPHPTFARLGDRNLLLPVAAGDATIIAYQAVSDERAVAAHPHRRAGQRQRVGALLPGDLLLEALGPLLPARRRRRRRPTSVLVGAPVGLAGTAPISGVVTAVKEYLLYGKYPDVQIDIRPEKTSGITRHPALHQTTRWSPSATS